jgi:hypothetical protein
MALTNTTTASAVGVNDTSMVVASATGFVANYVVKFLGTNEVAYVDRTYVSGTTIPLRRGQNGTYNQAHVSGEKVAVGAASDTDWQAQGPQANSQYPIAGKPELRASYSASGAITLPAPGTDLVVELNGTSALAMTVAAPVSAQEGCRLWIASNGAAAHTVTFAGGLSGAGSSYDVVTINATAPVLLGPFMAVNLLWQAPVAVPMAGTVTNVTATVA